MNTFEQKYLLMALQKISSWIDIDIPSQMQIYQKQQDYMIETDTKGYVYCLFSYPYSDACPSLKQCILFVYEDETIIADSAILHASMSDFLNDSSVLQEINNCNDWTYLNHYVLCKTMFEQWEPNETYIDIPTHQQAAIITNIYVTRSYRRQHIFTTMLEMIRDFALRNIQEDTIYYSGISLDPDVACYGPDTVSTPYVYSMEKDEPIRQINAKILTDMGYYVTRLEPDETNNDGAKLWFACKKEQETIIEQPEQTI